MSTVAARDDNDQRPVPIPTEYSRFLSFSRWSTEEDLTLRAQWFAGLSTPERQDALFRFEMMLKALVCFGNLRNHPGEKTPEHDSARDFRLEMNILQAAIQDLLSTARVFYPSEELPLLLVDRFQREERREDLFRLASVADEVRQNTPQQSLRLLLGALDGCSRIIQGLLETPRISRETFVALNAELLREVFRSRYFNCLSAFEFRAEYDAVALPYLVETLRSLDCVAKGRVTALTVLSMCRLLRCVELISGWDEDDGIGGAVALLTMLRSDGEQLARFLSEDLFFWMSADFGAEFQKLTPTDIKARYDDLHLQFEELKSLQELLESTGHQLDLEIRKAFLQQIPAIPLMRDPGAVMASVRSSLTLMRSFLQNAVVLIVREFNVAVEGDDIFEDFTSDVSRSERLRRDIWMFRQILKAFIAKTRSAELVGDRWVGLDTFRYVKTFVDYFRSMGYQLLRYSDYDRFDKFIAVIDRLREGDALEVQRMSRVIEECEAFYQFLDHMFESVGKRRELNGRSFDTRDAAQTLQLFIG